MQESIQTKKNTRESAPNTLQTLMLGLIYPAVLGNLLYLLFAKTAEQLSKHWAGQATDLNSDLAIKFGLLTITLAFYLADYLYIYFTREFRIAFFLCDIVFVLALAFTIFYVDIEHNNDVRPAWPILASYLVFMILYLCWDKSEKRKCEVDNKEEIDLYKSIITWEWLAIIGIVACLIPFLVELIFSYSIWKLISQDQRFPNLVLLILLVLITFPFWVFTLKKRRFHPSHNTAKPVIKSEATGV